MITSTRNEKVKQIRALQGQVKKRRETGLFVVEGVRMAEEVLTAGWKVEDGLYAESLSERGTKVVERLMEAGVGMEQASEHVLASASDTQSTQGVLLVMRIPESRLPERFDLCLIADGVRDPGNLGAMLRSAAAAGAQAVLLPPGNTDVYAPKVVRAGMGAHFRLALASIMWDEIAKIVEQQGMRLWLSEAGGEAVYWEADLTRASGIIIGGEAEGAGEQARNLAHGSLKIPMAAGSESLNAGAAAAILLFEAARQRGWRPATLRSKA